MDQMNDALSSLLSSPEAMETLKGLASSLLGSGGLPDPPVKEEPPVESLSSAASSLFGGGIDMSAIAKLLPLFSQMNQEDDNTRLLNALRPHLKEQRQKRLDEAAKLMQMARLLPIIKEQGIL